MKALNYIMTLAFGTLALTMLVLFFIKHRPEVIIIAIICFILAWVAWGDYKRCQDEEDV